MAKTVVLSKKWASYLSSLPETGMGYQVVAVVLKNGQKFERVVIDSGYITRVRGYGEIPFAETDIVEIRVTHDKWNWNESETSS